MHAVRRWKNEIRISTFDRVYFFVLWTTVQSTKNCGRSKEKTETQKTEIGSNQMANNSVRGGALRAGSQACLPEIPCKITQSWISLFSFLDSCFCVAWKVSSSRALHVTFPCPPIHHPKRPPFSSSVSFPPPPRLRTGRHGERSE